MAPAPANLLAKFTWGYAVCLAALVATDASAQTIESAQADIRSTYAFDPSKMTFDEQASRAPSLSALWGRFAKAPEVYREALRALLRADGGTELLYCDGGMLMLSKTVDAEDHSLGLKSIGRCSLAEIQHTPYFYTLHALAVRGVDTFNLQLRILEKPKYSVFIVQHALSLGQDYAFLYPLLVQEEAKYVTRLIERLRVEREATAQKSLVRALWYAATQDAESALRAFATSPAASVSAREDATKLLAGAAQARSWKAGDPTLKRILSNLNMKTAEPEADLRSKRRARMRSISDEALYDLEAYTALIYRATKGT